MRSKPASSSVVEDFEIHSFGLHPVTNRFLDLYDSVAPRYPLGLSIENKTGLVRLSQPFPTSELKPRYSWLTCFEPEDHLDRLAKFLVQLPGINHTSTFAGFSSKDDSTLERISTLGYKSCWRICPRLDLDINDNLSGIETFIEVFCNLPSSKIISNHGKADVFLVRHVLEHANNLPVFIEKIKAVVRRDGYIVFEVPDCERSFEVGDCTVLWEEHACYFTKRTLEAVLVNSGFHIVESCSIPYPLENSLVVILKLTVQGRNTEEKASYLDEELRRIRSFIAKYYFRKSNISRFLARVKMDNKPIAVFGAGHLTFTFISLYGLEKLIDFIVDDDSNKSNLIAPLGGIRILSSEALYRLSPKLCLLGTNPIKHATLVSRHDSYLQAGGRFGSIFPGTANYLEDLFCDGSWIEDDERRFRL